MYAVQFEANIEDWMIVIPTKEASMLPKKVQVILLADYTEEEKEKTNFDEIRVMTKGYSFNREQTNER